MLLHHRFKNNNKKNTHTHIHTKRQKKNKNKKTEERGREFAGMENNCLYQKQRNYIKVLRSVVYSF